MNTMATTQAGMRSHIQSNDIHVIKVGGENASDARTVEWLANFYNSGNHVSVAISALRANGLNTTDELIKARTAFDVSGMGGAMPILENLFGVHLETLRNANMYDSELGDKLRILFEHTFPNELPLQPDLIRESRESLLERRFIGYGEVMSAHVLAHLLDTRYRVATRLLTEQLPGNGRTLSDALRRETAAIVTENIKNNLVVVPGYVSVRDTELLPAYGRGYTDKTAERIAVGLSDRGWNPILHIQKQLPLLSSDPRKIPGARPVSALSYYSAGEITGARGANARVLNENTITRDLMNNNIPVWVYNPFEQDGAKSIISALGSSESGILFVDGRDHVNTITLSGFGMEGPGLLSGMTQFFTRYGIGIDSISSSETEVTFTTYNKLTESQNSELRRELGCAFPHHEVRIENNLGMIYCIGDNLSGHPGLLSQIGSILANEGIDIECISQSRGQRGILIGIHSENLKRGVAALHEALIEG